MTFTLQSATSKTFKEVAELFNPRYLRQRYPNLKDVLKHPDRLLAHLDTAISSPKWPESEPVFTPKIRDLFANFRVIKMKASAAIEGEAP